MTWQWIPLGILLFFVILFLLPISIRIAYLNEVALWVGLPGLYLPILPKKKKKINLRRFSAEKYRKLREKDRIAREAKKQKDLEKKRKKKAASALKKQEKAKKLPPEEPTDEPSVISLIMPVVGSVLNTFAGRLRVKVVRMDITVGGSDAAQIGMMYGIISQGAAYLMELIAQKTKFSRAYKTMIQVNADFLLAKTRADVQFIFRLRLWDLVVTAVKFLIGFIKEKTKQTPENTTASTKTPVKEVAK
ncbi:MAG: hypothetical protein E7662_08065 [Ruminococcaceae bacterium]|nr:hypothetical protein [Oscillospiraceae bacterium]